MKKTFWKTHRLWWVAFAAANAVYLLMIFHTLPALSAFSGGLSPPDMMAGGYDAAYLRDYFDRLGQEGRAYYLWRQLPLDMLYPALFAAAYLPAVLFLLRKTHLAGGWKLLAALPAAACACDYAENLLLIRLLAAHPEQPLWAAQAASVFTVGKSAAGAATFAAILLLIGVYVWRKTRAHG